MIRVVLDSNIFISALVFGGNPRRLIQLAEQGFVELYTSEPLRREVERVLALKFAWPARKAANAAGYLWSLAQSVEPQQRVNDCTDPDDNCVLECAIEAQAGWIVTGDHHLLAMHPYRGIAIVTARDFLSRRSFESRR